jgi:pyruvate carboxylase subunit B
MKYIASVDKITDFTIDLDRPGEIVVDDTPYVVDLRSIDGGNLYSLIVDHQSYDLYVERREGTYYILIGGDRFAVEVEDFRLKQLKAMGGAAHDETGMATLTAPMPGLVVKVLVAVGDLVAANQGIVILEAMKMENEIRSPIAGVVRSLNTVVGQAVTQGDLLAVVGTLGAEEGGAEASG